MLKQSTVHLEEKQEALRTCGNAQPTCSKEAKRQSAEQLGKEQAKRLKTQRTEDEHQCVNEAKLSDMVNVMKTSRAQSQTTSNKKDFLRITMVNGSSWSTKGISWSLTKAIMMCSLEWNTGSEVISSPKMLNKESKRYNIAAGDTQAAKEAEDVGAHISEGVFVAVAWQITLPLRHLVAKFDSLEENGGTIAEQWVKCHEGIHVFAVYFWHSEGWAVRTEELMKAALNNTRK